MYFLWMCGRSKITMKDVSIPCCYVEGMFWLWKPELGAPISIDCPDAIESGLCRDAL